jgi:hypothetical protein
MDAPFREKIAWIELVGMTLAYGGYFIAVELAKPPILTMILLFAAATAVRLLILGGGYLALASASRTPADERDRAVDRRASSIAYLVLLAAMILVGVIMPFGGETGPRVANSALAGVVLAELVRHGAVVFGYRRGWRA